jgi:hypothetical protein
MIRDILQQYRDESAFNRDLGDRFERLMRAYLKLDPQYLALFEDVWLWKDWPQREALGYKLPDTGIDLVAKLRDEDGYCAIQCKFYDSPITLGDHGNFFTLSGKGGPGPKPAPFAPPPESKQPTLRPKDQSPDGWVEYAQQLLNKNGAHLKVDGNFGPATEKAVRDFQQSKGCQVDGVIGNETWSMLRENTTKDAVGTDGRTPHTFEEKGVQARFATE